MTIGIIIPAYNPNHKWLRKALYSVIDQTRTDWLALVIDDGSNDSLDWCADMDERISVYRKPNTGVSASRNAGIRHFEDTEFIAFLDADDTWEKTHLEDHMEIFKRWPSIDVVTSEFRLIDEDDHYLRDGGCQYMPSFVYQDLLARCVVWVGTVVARTGVFTDIGMFNTELSTAEDWEMWLRMARVGTKFYNISYPTANYRQHGNGATRNFERILSDSNNVFEGEIAQMRSDGRCAEANRAISAWNQNRANMAFEHARANKNHPVTFVRNVGRSLRWDTCGTLSKLH